MTDLPSELPDDDVDQYRTIADALDDMADRLRAADSVAEEVPELAELFHEVRTSRRKSRDGKYVALLDYNDGGFECRSVAFLESGSHYRDTGADAKVGHKPFSFLGVDEFGEQVAASIRRDARAARQNADDLERSRKEAKQVKEHY